MAYTEAKDHWAFTHLFYYRIKTYAKGFLQPAHLKWVQNWSLEHYRMFININKPISYRW